MRGEEERKYMPKYMTVGDLKKRLEEYHDDWEIQFNGHTFNRLKMRDKKMVNMEFNETCHIEKEGDEV